MRTLEMSVYLNGAHTQLMILVRHELSLKLIS